MLRGDRFRELRLSRGYTHAELATLLDVSYSQINRYEANRIDATGDVLDRMATLFGVSADYLLGRTDTPNADVVALSPEEHAVISAMRQGKPLEAIKVIVNHASSQSSDEA